MKESTPNQIKYDYLYSIADLQKVGTVIFDEDNEDVAFCLFGQEFDPNDPPETIMNPFGDVPGLAVLARHNTTRATRRHAR